MSLCVEFKMKMFGTFLTQEDADLHDRFGDEFDKRYNELCDQAEEGLISNYRITTAKDLWKKMLKVLFETSHPWNDI